MPLLGLENLSLFAAADHGWTEERRQKTLNEYKLFLSEAANCQRDGRYIVKPSQDVDKLWHLHLLHSEIYVRDCTAWFGAYVHHRPALTTRQLRLLSQLEGAEWSMPLTSDSVLAIDMSASDDCSSGDAVPTIFNAGAESSAAATASKDCSSGRDG